MIFLNICCVHNNKRRCRQSERINKTANLIDKKIFKFKIIARASERYTVINML